MKIIVAGATGVIGRRVIPMLVARGHEVVGVARNAQKGDLLSRLGARPVTVDLFHAESVVRVTKGIDAVINLATSIPKSSRVMWPGAWRENSRVRRIVPANFAAAAKANGVGRFVQESFAPIYESAGDRWIDEASAVKPARYNRAVMEAERAAASAEGVVLRFGFFYGADSDFTRDAMHMVRRGIAPSFGDPEGFISSISHDDGASAVVAALGIAPGIYNVVDDEPVTKRAFAASLAVALGVRPPRHLPRFAGLLAGSLGETLSRSQRISNRKVKSASGWAPRWPVVTAAWPSVVNRAPDSRAVRS